MPNQPTTPEGAVPQDIESQQPNASQGIGEGLEALSSGTQALLQGLTESGAPPELVQLAQTAAQAIDQIAQTLGGGGQEAPNPDQPSAQELTQGT